MSAAARMKPTPSPFYPPRARWYSPLFGLGYRLRRALQLDELEAKLGCSLPRLLAVLVLPGYGFFAVGLRLIGKAALGFFALAALVFVVWLGYGIADVAFGLMVALHAIGAVCCLDHWWGLAFRDRVKLTVALLLLVCGGGYLPARYWVTHRWLLPLRVHGQVIVVKIGRNPGPVQRGDWIAYRTERRYLAPNVYLAGGYSIDQVRGMAGDRIRFTPEQFWVNGEGYPLLTNMPTSGQWVVPEKQWFVWPELTMYWHGVGRDQIAAAWRQAAFVDGSEYVGRAFHRWFWRRQSLP